MRAARKPRLAVSFLLFSAATLWGCSGGGNGGGSAPPPSNSAPVFTSASAGNAPENTSAAIYTATASDADGDALTYSLAGGADRALFNITSAGALSFAAAPDFERPADADRNNVYLVQIGVSDGSTSATLDLAITVTNGGPDAFRVARVGTGFVQPLFLAPVPDGTGRVFVLEKGGRIRILNPATGAVAATPFLDIAGTISTDGERGLLGMATAPDYQTSGVFYVYVTNPGGDVEIRRYRAQQANRDLADPASGDVVLSFEHSQFSNHNGGWIGFGPDGFLYAASGDGGGSGDPQNNGQNRNVLLGKILRIDVSRDDFPADAVRDYGIPAGNPFAAGGGSPEIWALGLRNPFRSSFDFVTGSLLIGDVGEGRIEEINLLRPSDGGANLGWALREGTLEFKGPAQPGFVVPVAEYSHGSGPLEGRSVTGGYVYRGPVESLRGEYIFGDFITGNLWSVPIDDLKPGFTVPSSQFTVRRSEFAPAVGAINNPVSFGVDQLNNLYIVDFDGEIFRIEVSG